MEVIVRVALFMFGLIVGLCLGFLGGVHAVLQFLEEQTRTKWKEFFDTGSDVRARMGRAQYRRDRCVVVDNPSSDGEGS